MNAAQPNAEEGADKCPDLLCKLPNNAKLSAAGTPYMLARCLSVVLALLWHHPAFAVDMTRAAKEFHESYDQPPIVPVLGGWQGNDSAVTAPSIARIMDDGAWAALWARHDPFGQPPKIDFKSSMVIAIFKGSVSDIVSGIHLESVLDKPELEVMSGVFIFDVSGGEMIRPYLFIVLVRSTKAIMVVERSVVIMDDPKDNVIGWLQRLR